MLIIGYDFHPGFQEVAIFDKQTGMTIWFGLRYHRPPPISKIAPVV